MLAGLADQLAPRSPERTISSVAMGCALLFCVITVMRFSSVPSGSTTIWLPMVCASAPGS